MAPSWIRPSPAVSLVGYHLGMRVVATTNSERQHDRNCIQQCWHRNKGKDGMQTENFLSELELVLIPNCYPRTCTPTYESKRIVSPGKYVPCPMKIFRFVFDRGWTRVKKHTWLVLPPAILPQQIWYLGKKSQTWRITILLYPVYFLGALIARVRSQNQIHLLCENADPSGKAKIPD